MTLTTTTQEEILEKAKDRLWDIKTAYALDREKIKSWLKRHAEVELGGGLQKDKAIAKYPSLSNDIKSLYDINEITISEKGIQDAKDGVLENTAPSTLGIVCLFLIFLMTSGLELAFFSYLVLFREAGVMLIGLAVLLLTGGALAGLGVTEIAIHGARTKYIGTKDKVSNLYIGFLAAGIVLIVGITAFRWVSGGIFAGITAAFFGLAVTTAEVAVEYKFRLRKLYLNLIYKAQQLYSARQIRAELKDLEKPDDDTFRVDYIAIIDSIAKTVTNTTTSII